MKRESREDERILDEQNGKGLHFTEKARGKDSKSRET